MYSRNHTLTHLALCCGLLGAPVPASAQPVNLVPTGALRFTINAGSAIAPVTTSFAISLLDTPQAAGATVARINAMTATTLTVTGANWIAGALATPSFPYAIRIITGAAVGATFPIGANTTDTLTFFSVDLTTFGLVTGTAGDSMRIIPVDTLNSLFGATTFLGGTNPTEADMITLSSSGTQLSYYYHTTLSRWVRTTGPTTDRGNIPIPLDGAISVTRKSAAMTLTFVGRVPDMRFSVAVPNSGPTYTHTGFPVDVSLGVMSLQTALPGWLSASTPGTADTLSVSIGAGWLSYFHNGAFWQRTTGPATNRDAIVIVAGTPILIFKRGTAAGASYFNRALPYSF
ncbi:MAG: hypothetical protein Q7S40_13915 [Opitutaceae bacterium]|nr:hypothetical protein [Opitutaceae bacterium]